MNARQYLNCGKLEKYAELFYDRRTSTNEINEKIKHRIIWIWCGW